MNEREFEEFILMQVKRSGMIYSFNAKLYRILILAGIVMFIAGLIMKISVIKGLGVVPLCIGFFFAAKYSRNAAKHYDDAAREMEYILSFPEFNGPEDYSEATRDIRKSACTTLSSTRGLIVSYGIIALCCWGGAAVMLAISTLEGSTWFVAMIGVGMIMIAMAVILTVLTIKSIMDLPMYRKYKNHLKESANENADNTDNNTDQRSDGASVSQEDDR